MERAAGDPVRRDPRPGSEGDGVVAVDDIASHLVEEVIDDPTGPIVIVRRERRVLREAALVLCFYYVYQTVRSAANHAGVSTRAFSNSNRLVGWERTLHIYNEQAVQEVFLPFRWFLRLVNVYYGTLHFAITAGVLIWLYLRHWDGYRRMRNLLGATTALALIGYWSFPLAPPRMRRWDGFVDTLDTIGGLWSYNSPVAKAVANPFAAMPSLHFGWALWCALALWLYAKHPWVRALAFLYPMLTLFAIVVTANHYWLDAAGGVLIFVGGLGITRLLDVLDARRAAEDEWDTDDGELDADDRELDADEGDRESVSADGAVRRR
jgi:PAP2 superfamily